MSFGSQVRIWHVCIIVSVALAQMGAECEFVMRETADSSAVIGVIIDNVKVHFTTREHTITNTTVIAL